MINTATLITRCLSPILLSAIALSTFSTAANAGNMYIYKDKAGQVLLTNVNPSGNFDKFTKKVKVTYYKDSKMYDGINSSNGYGSSAASKSGSRNAYDSYIRASAERHGVDPALMKAMMHTESAFNPNARSPVGAQGLMQLMPSTAKRLVSYKRKVELFNPDLNIKGGTMYLKKLLNNFDGNIVLALSSYNAGPNKVKRWMNGIFSSNDPIFMIEEIPYRETRLYVKLIYRNLFFYSLLNNKYLLDDNLKSTFKVTMNKESTR